jgi:butyryl-CoA dehydrogenase
MDFNLSEEQQMVRDAARKFAENTLKPRAEEIDETGRIPEDLVEELGQLGYTAMVIDEKYGGAGFDNLSYIIAIEEFSKGSASAGVMLSVTNTLTAGTIETFGTDDQKEKYLSAMAQKNWIGGFCLTEPEAGTDAGAVQMTAVKEGDSYILNGTKLFITNGGFADFFIVIASTDKEQKHKGLSAFIVEKEYDGFSVGKRLDKMGIKGSDTRELIFEDVKVPAENLLGKEGDGFKISMVALDAGRIGIAAQALGIAEAALDEAIQYSKERKQFGRPISAFQAVAFMLADMATQVEAARYLVYHAAFVKDQGAPYGKAAAMAKLFASEMASYVTDKAVQIHGGYGYMKEYAVERHFRDAKITEIYEGTSEVQRMVISGALLR